MKEGAKKISDATFQAQTMAAKAKGKGDATTATTAATTM